MGTEIDGVNGIIKNTTSDGDITIKGNDGGSEVSALVFDMSDAGSAAFNHDVKLPDNAKLKLGNSGDLQIYHDGSTSYLDDNGEGDFGIRSNGTKITLNRISDGHEGLKYILGGALSIKHNNSTKLATTATGVDITGAFTATAASTITLAGTGDNLTLASTDAGASAAPNLRLYRNSSSPADDDLTATIDFEWRNDNSQDVIGFQISNFCRDVSDGAEENIILFKNMFNGTLTEFMRADSQSDQAVVTINELSNDIDFRVESNGQTHMIHVDAGSDHVNIAGGGTDGGGVFNVFSADNTTTLSLVGTDSDASAGPILSLERSANSAATGDEIGKILFKAQNAANETIEYCEIRTDINDATDGSEDGRFIIQTIDGGSAGRSRMEILPAETIFNQDSADIDFRVESNDFSHMLFVDAGLNEVMVGGNSEQNSHFSVQNGTTSETAQVNTCINASYTGIVLDMGVSRNTTNGTYTFLKCQRRGFANSVIITDGGTMTTTNNSYGAISDERLKSNITDANSQWNDIKALKVKNYKMLQDPDQNTHIGVISQDLETAGMNGLINEAEADEYQIAYVDDESVLKAGDKVKEVKYSVLYMKAIKALQEAQTRIETLETKVAALEG